MWVLPFASLAVFMGAHRYLEQLPQLDRAETALLENRPEIAYRKFTAALASPWFHDRAQVGTLLCAVLMGKEPPVSREVLNQLPAAAFSRIPGELLLYPLLSRGEFQICHNLAALLEERQGSQTAKLYRLAASIELGERGSLRVDWADVPVALRSTTLGRRIGEVLEKLDSAPLCMVYDRRGTPVGQLRDRHRFEVLPSVDSRLLPVSTLEAMDLPKIGRSVRLGLDMELSQIARRALGRYRGSIVIVNPRTGEILAAISDDRSLRREGTPAFTQLREPASISKLITTTAGLRQGIDVAEEISHMTCRGAKRFGQDFLYCSYPAGRLRSLNRALALSCNIAFAQLGVEIGRSAILDELHRFGFDQHCGLPIQLGRTLQPTGNSRQLADMSIGLEATALTPVHAALIAATFANHGVRPEPQLVSARDGLLGLSPQLMSFPEGDRVVKNEWLPPILSAMRAVVEQGGTAYGVAPGGLEVAMKTGTAATPSLGYHTNYIGFTPAQEPRIAFCVRVTNQRTSSDVRYASKQVTKRLLQGLEAYIHHRRGAELLEFTSSSDIALNAAEFEASRRLFLSPDSPSQEGG